MQHWDRQPNLIRPLSQLEPPIQKRLWIQHNSAPVPVLPCPKHKMHDFGHCSVVLWQLAQLCWLFNNKARQWIWNYVFSQRVAVIASLVAFSWYSTKQPHCRLAFNALIPGLATIVHHGVPFLPNPQCGLHVYPLMPYSTTLAHEQCLLQH